MNWFQTLKNVLQPDPDHAEFHPHILQWVDEFKQFTDWFYTVKFSDIPSYAPTVQSWDADKKVRFICYLIRYMVKVYGNTFKGMEGDYDRIYLMCNATLAQILKSNLQLNAEQLELVTDYFINYKKDKNLSIVHWPVSGLIKQFEFAAKSNNTIITSVKNLNRLKTELTRENERGYNFKDLNKFLLRLEALINPSDNESGIIAPLFFNGDDEFTVFANQFLNNLPIEEKACWFKLMALASKANGAKPTMKFLSQVKEIMDEMGNDKFRKGIQFWFEYLIALKDNTTTTRHEYNGTIYEYHQTEYISTINADLLKGFVWCCVHFSDALTLRLLGSLAERTYRKIPGKGQSASALGNACLYSLANSRGLDGIAQISRLKVKVKQASTIVLIEKYLEEAAQKRGVSTTEIEDMAVDDFKLINHERSFEIANYNCILRLKAPGKSQLHWYKENGEEQKTVPQVLKEKHASQLKKIKEIQKQIDQSSAAQKERFDRMLRLNRQIPLPYFQEKYMQHGLLRFVLKDVIFTFGKGKERIQLILQGETWTDVAGQSWDIGAYDWVCLWHPVLSPPEEVLAWRNFLLEKLILQPFKQAFREIYLLTDAEIKTKTYSNRMASHILRQHQYVTLAKGRLWNAKLLGSWDGGDSDIAYIRLPEFKLRAEYWVQSLNADDAFNESGIWNYVTTDQIRFVNTETEEVLNLIDVPPLIFSEVLRDVDLFVGVASVGNDPTWADSGGMPAYRDYWQSYSFGDLSEIARSRKEILARLLPRLKIASVAEIKDRFLHVKGKLRHYKIHIGSTNILMEPNDQYLCIVPDRTLKSNTENVFLPFEGDQGLSLLISKAFLLANDDKITDSTITSQIQR